MNEAQGCRCPHCGAAEVQKLSVVYESGLSSLTSWAHVRFNQGPLGPGAIVTAKGNSQTAISKKSAPPTRKSYGRLLLINILVSVLLTAVFFAIVKREAAALAFARYYWLALMPALAYCVYLYNCKVWPMMFSVWDAQAVCQVCGKFFSMHPVSLEISYAPGLIGQVQKFLVTPSLLRKLAYLCGVLSLMMLSLVVNVSEDKAVAEREDRLRQLPRHEAIAERSRMLGLPSLGTTHDEAQQMADARQAAATADASNAKAALEKANAPVLALTQPDFEAKLNAFFKAVSAKDTGAGGEFGVTPAPAEAVRIVSRLHFDKGGIQHVWASPIYHAAPLDSPFLPTGVTLDDYRSGKPSAKDALGVQKPAVYATRRMTFYLTSAPQSNGLVEVVWLYLSASPDLPSGGMRWEVSAQTGSPAKPGQQPSLQARPELAFKQSV